MKRKILNEALAAAVENGERALARYFLAVGANPNRPGEYGDLPLTHAAGADDVEFVTLLLDFGADPDGSSSQGATALHAAANAGSVRAASVLLERGANVDLSSDGGMTPLMLAARQTDSAMLRMLLDAGADPYLHSGEWTALRWAASMANSDEGFAAVRLLALRDSRLHGLSLAALLDAPALAEALLTHGLEPDMRDVHGETPLNWAAMLGWGQTVKVLLDGGADANVRGMDESTPLHHAGRRRDPQLIRDLIAAGADVHAREGRRGWTALMYAASHGGSDDVVRVLLEAGADVHAQAAYEVTALELACFYGEPEIVELLLDAGADPNTRGSKGTTPLIEAAKNGQHAIIRMLLDRGADLHAQRDDAKNAWWYADWHSEGAGTREFLEAFGAGPPIDPLSPEERMEQACKEWDEVKALMKQARKRRKTG